MSLNISSNSITSSNQVKLLGIKIDSRLNFEPHISDLCKTIKCSSQVKAVHNFSRIDFTTKILIERFVYSNFYSCPLVWTFTSAKATNKIGSVQKRALRFLFDDYESCYDTLPMKAKKPKMTVQRLRYLCAEIYRTVNGLNPNYMKNFFKKSDTLSSKRMQHQNNLIVPRPNYFEFDAKILTSLGSKIWNSLPVNIKSAETFEGLKKLFKTLDGAM